MSADRLVPLPPGTKLSGPFQINQPGPHFGTGNEWTAVCKLQIDNVYDVLDLAAVPIPDGYERAGTKPEEWFDDPGNKPPFDASLYFLTVGREPCRCDCYTVPVDGDRRRIILRKIAPPVKRVLVCEWEIGDLRDDEKVRGNEINPYAAERIAAAARGVDATFGTVNLPTPPRAWIKISANTQPRR